MGFRIVDSGWPWTIIEVSGFVFGLAQSCPLFTSDENEPMPLWAMAKRKVVEKGHSARLSIIHPPFPSSAPPSPELGVCQDGIAVKDSIHDIKFFYYHKIQ